MAQIVFNERNNTQKSGLIIGHAWKAKNDCISVAMNRGTKEQRVKEVVLKPGDRMLLAPRKKNKASDPDFVVFGFSE